MVLTIARNHTIMTINVGDSMAIVQQTISAYRELTGDSEFLRLVRMREDAAHDEASALANAEKKGILIGEQKRNKELALMMRSDGESEEKIIHYTGYTLQELDSLK